MYCNGEEVKKLKPKYGSALVYTYKSAKKIILTNFNEICKTQNLLFSRTTADVDKANEKMWTGPISKIMDRLVRIA